MVNDAQSRLQPHHCCCDGCAEYSPSRMYCSNDLNPPLPPHGPNPPLPPFPPAFPPQSGGPPQLPFPQLPFPHCWFCCGGRGWFCCCFFGSLHSAYLCPDLPQLLHFIGSVQFLAMWPFFPQLKQPSPLPPPFLRPKASSCSSSSEPPWVKGVVPVTLSPPVSSPG